MDNMNEKILKNLKSKIAVSNFEEKELNMKTSNRNKVFKSIVAASIILISSTGLVFAKEIEKIIADKFNLRTIHQITVDNGYIGTADMDYIEVEAGVRIGDNKKIVDTVNTKLKISDFMLTDDFFKFQVDMKFDEKINQYKNLNKRVGSGNIDYENFGGIELEKVFILDESDNLLVSPVYQIEEDEQAFNKFCEEHNLNYKYREFNENYFENISSIILSGPDVIIPEENTLKDIIFSISNDTISDDLEKETTKYPKSKHLSIYFSEITFIPKLNSEEEVHLVGDWKIDIDIPPIMQNREDYTYKVVNCDNKDFNIVSAVADETEFRIELSIDNVKQVRYPEELQVIEEIKKEENYKFTREGLIEFYGSEELADLCEKYYIEKKIINFTGEKEYYWESDSNGKGCYIVNNKGNGFGCANTGQVFNFKSESIYDENGFSQVKILDIYEGTLTFAMTKFDCTDKLTVVVDFKGEPVKIELEKIDN